MVKKLPESAKLLNQLIKTYEKDPKTWHQGDTYKYDIKGNIVGFCLLGGIRHFALKMYPDGWGWDSPGYLLSAKTQDYISNIVGTDIVEFNDEKCKSVKPVLTALRKTVDLIKRVGA